MNQEKKPQIDSDFKRFHYGYTNGQLSCPCKGCTDRSAECHSKCEPYLEYEKQRFDIRNGAEKKWKTESPLWAHEQNTKRRKENAWRHKKRT